MIPINREADPRWAMLEAYVRQCADTLRPKDWELVILRDPPSDGDAIASCYPTEGRRRATLRFSDEFYSDGPISQRLTIVHELIHCHLSDTRDVVRLDLFRSHALSQREYESVDGALVRQMEYAVDDLAAAFAPFLPLPALGDGTIIADETTAI